MIPYLIHHYFDEAVGRFGDKTAIICQEQSASFQELYRASNRIANYLSHHGLQRGDRVCILLPKSISSITAMLGVLKANGIYVPLDSESPGARVKIILADCEPVAVICSAMNRRQVQEYRQALRQSFSIIVLQPSGADILPNDDGLAWLHDIEGESSESSEYKCIDLDTAYILYTSGSSGKPKGVMISHLNFCNYIEWALDYFRIESHDNILNTAPLHFDMAVFDIFASLGAGATLTLVPQKMQLFASKLVEIITLNRITIWKAVAFLLAYFVRTRALRRGIMPDLKTIIFSGEPLAVKYIVEWMRVFPDKKFYNAYGPTEATGISTCHEIKNIPLSMEDTIPIGTACKNTEVFAITESGSIAKPGETGELFIRGSGVSPGYWNNLEKTAQAFVTVQIDSKQQDRVYRTGDIVKRLLDGQSYVFVGRKDFQIKHMGYRIEPGEIEAAICMDSGISDATVVAVSAVENDSPEIVAFVETETTIPVSQIMVTLRERLPTYMVPHKLIKVASLPRTGNGKVDRQRLKAEYVKRSLPVKPKS